MDFKAPVVPPLAMALGFVAALLVFGQDQWPWPPMLTFLLELVFSVASVTLIVRATNKR